jgi:hypothetical protein
VAVCNPVVIAQLPNVIPCSKEMSFLEAGVRSANQGISHILWFVTLSSRVRCWSVSESETLCVVLLRANIFLMRGIVSIVTSTNPPLVGCSRLFVKHIHNYPSCLAADFFHQQPQDMLGLSDKVPTLPLFVTLYSSLIRFRLIENPGWSN